jgi:hypothetical protein
MTPPRSFLVGGGREEDGDPYLGMVDPGRGMRDLLLLNFFMMGLLVPILFFPSFPLLLPLPLMLLVLAFAALTSALTLTLTLGFNDIVPPGCNCGCGAGYALYIINYISTRGSIYQCS